MKINFNFFVLIFLFSFNSYGNYILIPMDEEKQRDHLKAYGIAYWILENEVNVDWLVNYRGGSFLIKNINEISNECTYRGVSFEILSNYEINEIFKKISSPSSNMDIIKLRKKHLKLQFILLKINNHGMMQ